MKHSRIMGGDGNRSQNTHNKRQCPTCGTTTHKKGGILGKKYIPITVEGRVHQGRCLSCDPFPASHGPAVVLAAATSVVHRAQGREELHHRRLSNSSGRIKDEGNRGSRIFSPIIAMVTAVDATTKRTAAPRHKSSRLIDAEPEQDELYHDSEENSNHGKILGRRNSNGSRLREQQQRYQQSQLQRTQIGGDINNHDTRGIEDTTRLTPDVMPSSGVAAYRATAPSVSRITTTGVPKTLEVVRRGLPRSSNSSIGGNGFSNASINSNNFGDDHSVVSAITMDFHLFQSYGGGEDSLDDDINDDDLPPPTSYHRRPGPERNNGRNYYSRNHKNNTNTFVAGDADYQRRRRRRSFNNKSMGSSNHSGRSRNGQNRHPYSSIALHATTRHSSPLDDYGNGIGTGTHSRSYALPPAAVATGVVETGSRPNDENPYYYSDHIPNVPRASNANNKSRMINQESRVRSNENDSKKIKNHPTQTQQLLSSSTRNGNRINSHIDDSEDNVPSISIDTPAIAIDDDDFPSFIMDDNDHNDNYDYNPKMLRQQHQYQQLESHDHRRIMMGLEQENTAIPQATFTPVSLTDSCALQKSSNFSKTITEKQDIDDMQGILRCLNLEECNPDTREQALCKLVDTIQSTSQSYFAGDRDRHIREFLVENDVIEAVTKSMWADMEIVEVQEAVMNVLLFIAASVDISYNGVGSHGEQISRKNNSDLLSKNESICDYILFTMQNHAAVHGIQLKGSLIFAALAASSADDNNVSINADGSLSGAMTMVLNAMSNHGDSRPIRKAGLQALHHQCLLSAYAEDNKRLFVESTLGNGMPAVDLLIYAMEELQKDAVAMEWACQLCWCLTANVDSLKQIERASLHEATMTICQHYMTNPKGIGLVEASIGTIANLAFVERKRIEMINNGAVELVLDSLRYHEDDFGVSNEAALALENFALPPYLPDVSVMLLKSDAVPLLVQGLKTFIDYPEYVIQGFRALTGIAARCDEGKETIISQGIIPIVQVSGEKHRNSGVLEICSTFVATLATEETGAACEFMIEHGMVNFLLFAIEFCPEEKVQDSACLALRNLSCHTKKPDEMLRSGKTSKFIVGAMDAHRNSLSIQTNGCCIFLNLLSKSNENEFAFNPKIVSSITKAMQSHIESGDLLELACGALWAMVDRFDDQKVYVGNEAIDVVACAMVMHPGTTTTLEKACGFLSNLSSDESLAMVIAKAQGVSIVSETMCNNASSISLLESGCLMLKNIILVYPSYAQDVALAISTLVMAMNDNVRSTSFVKEACDILWVLASENENIRSKVLALDGISILMKCLEQNSNHTEVETSEIGRAHV